MISNNKQSGALQPHLADDDFSTDSTSNPASNGFQTHTRQLDLICLISSYKQCKDRVASGDEGQKLGAGLIRAHMPVAVHKQ